MLSNQQQLLVKLEIDGETIDYFYAINGDDDSEVSNFIRENFNNGNLNYEMPDSSKVFEYNASSCRAERNNLLSDTDKYMTLDYPISDENRDILRNYRQALRDLPQQEGFPHNVIWPEKPNFI